MLTGSWSIPPDADRLRASREMKSHNVAFVLLAVCVVAFAGCKKTDQSVAPDTQFNGVKVDLPKFETEFSNSDQELQKAASLAARHIRYSQFPEALGDLERLSANPSLTEAQKKIATEVLEQTKQVIAKAPPTGQ
jgi:hypothetical protein